MDVDNTHNVALFNPGETEHNTIVLGGVDVIIPLELDMDGDPFQDDAVCLRSQGGDWEDTLLSSDSDVTASPDTRHLFYAFRDVPAGLYHLDVRIADRWNTVISNLLVTQGKAWLGNQLLSEKATESTPALDDPHPLVDHHETHHQDCGCCS